MEISRPSLEERAAECAWELTFSATVAYDGAPFALSLIHISVSRDFDVLRDYGCDVLFDSSVKRWRMGERPFAPEELVMLVDAVQSAGFLTERMALGLSLIHIL